MRRALKRNRLRLGCVKIVFLVVFLIVGGRAFQLQLFQGDRLMRLGQRQHLKEWIVLPKRGAVIRPRQRTLGAEFGIAIGLCSAASAAEPC